MADYGRVAALALEAAVQPDPGGRVAALALEAAVQPDPGGRVAALILEVHFRLAGAPGGQPGDPAVLAGPRYALAGWSGP